VERTIATALALHCRIPEQSKFDRKNYQYPDLPKGYQITQYDQPIGLDGWLEYEFEGRIERCGIVRVHLEEDTGKTIHSMTDERDVSLVDYNRSGVPLMEIVSAPEIASPGAARAYFETLRRILVYLGASDGNLQDGSMRVDINVSLLAPTGDLGTKVEIKNLNSFRAVQRSLQFEIARQGSLISAGEAVQQETRGWSERTETTVLQRSKEQADDYRYFPEPDLPMLRIPSEMIDEIARTLPELPAERRERLQTQYQLSTATASTLTEEREIADFFEQSVRAAEQAPAQLIANWVSGDLLRLVNESGASIDAAGISPQALGTLVDMLVSSSINGPGAKLILDEIFSTGEDPKSVADRLNLRQINDDGALAALIDDVLGSNAAMVDSYRAGKTKVFEALVGKLIQASNRRADPARLRALLSARLDAG
ncbi:MAG: Asp-tRNA(Asn)/Glu-tRNA(Gln) amidotransferase subunit GatB, partial [Chloroflexota bacterium]